MPLVSRDGETWSPAQSGAGFSLPEPKETTPSAEKLGSNLTRGFTGHEMLDDVGLIHMNGRLYDPGLGRMCMADPYVQSPENPQNYNRYSYVLNNPVSAIDPSGHIFGFIAAVVAAIVGILAGVIMTVLAFVAYLAALAAQFVLTVVGLNGAAAAMGSMGSSLLAAAKAGLAMVSGITSGAAFGGGLFGKMVAGAALSAIYSGGQTAINGGSFSDVLKSAAIGAATGAVGAAVGGVLAAIPGAVSSAAGGGAVGAVSGAVVHSAAHGVAGGLMSMAMGGSFQDGFIGSAIGAGVGHLTGFGFGGVMEDLGIVGRTAVAAVSGGVSSALAGGKFSDGAFSAAFFHIFNNEFHRAADESRPEAIIKDSRIKRKIFLINKSAEGDVKAGIASGQDMWDYATSIDGASYIDISKENWRTELARLAGPNGSDLIAIFDHGTPGDQWFNGHGNLTPSNSEWNLISSSTKIGGRVLLFGCKVALGDLGQSYIRSLAGSAYTRKIIVTGMSTNMMYKPSRMFEGGGVQVSSQYSGLSNFTTLYTNYKPPYAHISQ